MGFHLDKFGLPRPFRSQVMSRHATDGHQNARGQEKVAISDQYLAIARKRLKIDGYMLLCYVGWVAQW